MTLASIPLLAQVQVVPAASLKADIGPQIAFWAFALLTLGGAVATITRRNLVSAVMAMVASFFGIAGLYALLSAHFLAAIQVLIYAGAIMVLFVFVIMVLNREEAEPWAVKGLFSKALGVGSLAYLVVRLSQLILTARLPNHAEPPPPSFGTVNGVGEVFFTDFLFPFEAVSILLIIAIIGAVVLARTTVAHASSVHDLPEGEPDMRQPQHGLDDEVVGVPWHGRGHRDPNPGRLTGHAYPIDPMLPSGPTGPTGIDKKDGGGR